MIKKMSKELEAHLSGAPLDDDADVEKLREEFLAREQAAFDAQQKEIEENAPAPLPLDSAQPKKKSGPLPKRNGPIVTSELAPENINERQRAKRTKRGG